MPTLHVRNVPEDLYERLRQVAGNESRSLGAVVVDLLDRAVEERRQRPRQQRLLSVIRRRRQRRKPNPAAPDSVRLLREDRRR